MTTFLVHIYTRNSTNLYDTPALFTPSAGSSIYSVWVNSAGNTLYISTMTGVRRMGWTGTNWVDNTPVTISTLFDGYFITMIKLTPD